MTASTATPIISVLDYGCGNIQSVIRMLERAGAKAVKISTPVEIQTAEALILPGVGAFDHGMDQLRTRGLIHALDRVADEGHIPVLGICLGMQLMCKDSQEGRAPGLGWFNAHATRFPQGMQTGLPVPHMGWNTVASVRENPLLPPGGEEQRFYFVHSYCVHCADPVEVVANCSYGEEFVAAFHRNNLFGVQFHPEKSHRFGLALMHNFIKWSRAKA